jgi:hypothetical protein
MTSYASTRDNLRSKSPSASVTPPSPMSSCFSNAPEQVNSMAPSLSAGERPAQKASRRRLIQPVLPALPQFPSSGRKQQPTAQAVEIDTHSDLGLQTEQSSRRPSTIGSIDLTNLRHDAIPQHQELEAPLSSERPDVDGKHCWFLKFLLVVKLNMSTRHSSDRRILYRRTEADAPTYSTSFPATIARHRVFR